MISLDLSISGGELGRKLVDDEEELAYAFAAMVEENSNPRKLGADLYEHVPYGEAPEIAAWLRQLADGLEQGDIE